MYSVTQTLDRKRRGLELDTAEITDLVVGIGQGEVSDAQLGAFTMAVRFNGMNTSEQTALTLAMRDSGRVLRWQGLNGPVLDKHSTGGVSDWVSLLLAPLVAAAGAYVPMISGRGLGHTGGTLDKLESIPGFSVKMDLDTLRKLVAENGLAMTGQGPDLAPADGRIYAIRDVTSTVESIPLIVSSILAKKLAEGLDGLVLDVKTGNGATMRKLEESTALARQLKQTAVHAGTPCRALITDMSQPLGTSAGNALEVREAIDFVTGARRSARFKEVALALAAEMLVIGKLATDEAQAREKLLQLLDNGGVAEKFAKMVAAQGGPVDLLERPDQYLASAPVVRPVPAPTDGWVNRFDTRALGHAVLRLGGGRVSGGDTIDPAVGLSRIVRVGKKVDRGQPLCMVHAATEAGFEAAAARITDAVIVAPEPCAVAPVIHDRI